MLAVTTASAQYNTRRGTGVGGVTGAVIGGVIGNQNDETVEGALIGGAVGAVAGGLLGRQQDINDFHAYNYYQTQQAIAAQQAARAVSIADVVMMTRNGLSDQVIINHLRINGVQQSELSVHDIVSMHQAGVSENVIHTVQQVAQGPTVPGPPIVAPPPIRVGSPVVIHPRVGYYYHRGHCRGRY
jgi:uncharacterized protein YcfJ